MNQLLVVVLIVVAMGSFIYGVHEDEIEDELEEHVKNYYTDREISWKTIRTFQSEYGEGWYLVGTIEEGTDKVRLELAEYMNKRYKEDPIRGFLWSKDTDMDDSVREKMLTAVSDFHNEVASANPNEFAGLDKVTKCTFVFRRRANPNDKGVNCAGVAAFVYREKSKLKRTLSAPTISTTKPHNVSERLLLRRALFGP